MMILHTTLSAYIISHPDSIRYTTSGSTTTNGHINSSNDEQVKTYQLNPTLFHIHKPFITKSLPVLGPIAEKVQAIYTAQVIPYFEYVSHHNVETSSGDIDNSDTAPDTNDNAIRCAKDFFMQDDYPYEKFIGANPELSLVISEFKGRKYLFPHKSKFYNCDIFTHKFGEEELYDLVVLDPPWKNKFIKRRKGNSMGYDTHSTDAIENLQVGSILADNGVLAIWSTNSKTEKILDEMIGKWGLVHVSTFYWLKVTTKGEVTVPFTKQNGKQPFESLILAAKTETMIEHYKYPVKLIVSTPSAINSHKPPLTEILEEYFQRQFTSKCELFARYLQPGYSSYGNQVLKLNNLSLFKELA